MIFYGRDLFGCSLSEALINTMSLKATHSSFDWEVVKSTGTWDGVMLKKKNETADGTTFLEYIERQTKIRTGADQQQQQHLYFLY